MTEEEKEAIEYFKEIIKQTEIANECGLSTNDFLDEIKTYNAILNLIQKQQEELGKKDKIIDEMAEAISKYTPPNEEFDFCGKTIFECQESDKNKDCKECVKQYFERKAEV